MALRVQIEDMRAMIRRHLVINQGPARDIIEPHVNLVVFPRAQHPAQTHTSVPPTNFPLVNLGERRTLTAADDATPRSAWHTGQVHCS